MEGKEIIENMTVGSFQVVKAHGYFQVVSDRGVLVADCDYLDKKYPCPIPIAIRFNAELICEAFNVSNQTGMTPATLQAELEKAKELLNKANELIEIAESGHFGSNGWSVNRTEFTEEYSKMFPQN